uniref:Uncharacterized protein n=1 Tax=Rhizophora mucronata TaxID=61149 RepID=A0A2P2NMY4_RHIMU
MYYFCLLCFLINFALVAL